MIGLLNLLEPYDLVSSGGLDNPLNVHRLLEAMKFAFGARSEVTDPKFAENVTRLDDFWTKEWADEIRPKITDVSGGDGRRRTGAGTTAEVQRG
jgi:gamma-glutamyltranspeptidase/glutathione hydrolase/leukotriene-C4 hydrolase